MGEDMENVDFDDMTYQQKILFVMQDGKWYLRRQIKSAVGLDHKRDKNKTRALSDYLLKLVRGGYIERAYAPEVVKVDPLDHINYVYRITGKE